MLLAREVVQPGSFVGRPWETAALAWVMWVGYALERWMDARRGFTKGGTARHAFVRRHDWVFLSISLVVLAGLLIPSAPAFAPVVEAFAKYRSVFFLAPLFLLLNARYAPESGWFVRACGIALILTLLAAKQSVLDPLTGGMQQAIYLGLALPVFALVLANLSVIRRAEEPARRWQLRLAPMAAAVIGTVFTFMSVPGTGGPAVAAAFGGASLWFLDRRSEGIPAEMIRARADLLTFLSLAAGIWIR